MAIEYGSPDNPLTPHDSPGLGTVAGPGMSRAPILPGPSSHAPSSSGEGTGSSDHQGLSGLGPSDDLGGTVPSPSTPADDKEILLPGPVVIGTPVFSFEPKPATWSSWSVFRPDTIAEGWASDDFIVRCASMRGYSHRWEGIPRQDDLAVVVHQATGTLLVAVGDGVSASSLSHVGATWACHAAIKWLSHQLDSGVSAKDLPWGELLTRAALALVEYARDHLPGMAENTDEAGRLLSTTLITGVVVPNGDGTALASLVSAGDSGAWMLSDGTFSAMPGSKLSGSEDITDSSVSYPLPSISPTTPRPYTILLSPRDVLLVGTDGFGDPLGSGRGEVGRVFARHLAQPPSPLGFAHLLDFSRETYDDDRTLVAIWTRHRS